VDKAKFFQPALDTKIKKTCTQAFQAKLQNESLKDIFLE